MLAAIRGEPVDRLPAATYNCHPFSWGRHREWAEYGPILDAVRRTGAGMLCKVGGRRSGGLPEPEVAETVEGGHRVSTCVLPTPEGPLRRVVVAPPGQPSRCVEPYVKDARDIDRLLSLQVEPVRWDVQPVLDACAEIGEAGLAYVDYTDPFGWVVALFEQEDLLIRIHTDPSPVFALIDWAFDWVRDELAALLDALAPTGAEVLLYTCGPEYATPPLMSPRTFARVITPQQAPLVARIHRRGFAASMHCHGRVRQVLDEVIACGFDVLEPIEPPVQGDISLPELRQRVGDRLCLMGHVQDQELYTAGPQRIRDHVAQIIETIGKGTRFVATPTCTPFAFPPPEHYVENYIAFLEAAGALGA